MQILGFPSILLLLISAPTLAFFVSLFASLLISSRAILNAISPDNSSPLWPTIASHRLALPGTARAEGTTRVHATFQTALIPSSLYRARKKGFSQVARIFGLTLPG